MMTCLSFGRLVAWVAWLVAASMVVFACLWLVGKSARFLVDGLDLSVAGEEKTSAQGETPPEVTPKAVTKTSPWRADWAGYSRSASPLDGLARGGPLLDGEGEPFPDEVVAVIGRQAGRMRLQTRSLFQTRSLDESVFQKRKDRILTRLITAVSADGRVVALGRNDSPQVEVADAPARKTLGRLAFAAQPTSFTFSPDSKLLAIGGSDGGDRVLEVWAIADGKVPLFRAKPGQGTLEVLTFSGDGMWLAVAGEGGAVLYQREGDTFSHRTDIVTDSTVGALAVSRDGRWVATAEEKRVTIWSVGEGTSERLREQRGWRVRVNGIAVALVYWLAGLGLVALLLAWCPKPNLWLRSAPLRRAKVWASAVLGTALLAALAAVALLARDVAEWGRQANVAAEVGGLAFAPDDSEWFSVESSGQVRRWRLDGDPMSDLPAVRWFVGGPTWGAFVGFWLGVALLFAWRIQKSADNPSLKEAAEHVFAVLCVLCLPALGLLSLLFGAWHSPREGALPFFLFALLAAGAAWALAWLVHWFGELFEERDRWLNPNERAARYVVMAATITTLLAAFVVWPLVLVRLTPTSESVAKLPAGVSLVPNSSAVVGWSTEWDETVIRGWDLASGESRFERRTTGFQPAVFASSEDGGTLAYGLVQESWTDNAFGLLCYRHLGPGATKNQPWDDDVFISQATFFPDGKNMAVDHGGWISVVEVPSLRESGRLAVPPRIKFNTLVVSPDGQRIACGHYSSKEGPKQDAVAVYRIRDWKRERLLPVEGAVEAVAFSHDGAVLAGASRTEGTIQVAAWDVCNGKELARIPEPLTNQSPQETRLAFAPDARTLGIHVPSREDKVYLWNLDTGAVRSVASSVDPPRTVVFAPRGERPFVTFIRDPNQYTHRGSQDGKLIAGTDRKGHLTVHDVATSKELVRLPLGKRNPYFLAFAPDGRHLAVRTEDYSLLILRLWDANGADGLLAACNIVLARDPRNVEVLTRRGGLHLEAGRPAEALADACTALAAEPAHRGALHLLGLACARGKDPAGALRAFDELIRLDDKDALAWYRRGLAHADRGDIARARSDLERALRLDPALGAPPR